MIEKKTNQHEHTVPNWVVYVTVGIFAALTGPAILMGIIVFPLMVLPFSLLAIPLLAWGFSGDPARGRTHLPPHRHRHA